MNSPENGIARFFRIKNAQGALLSVLSMMLDPGFTEHKASEASIWSIPTVLGVSRTGFEVKSVRCRPYADHRFPGVHIIDYMLHLTVRQIAEASKEHHQIGRVECFQARDVVKLLGIDITRFAIYSKQD